MVQIGIDLGGTNIAVGIVDDNGRIIKSGHTPTLPKRSYQELIKDMAQCSIETLATSGFTLDDVRSIGIGVPGVTAKEGVVSRCVNLAWYDVPLAREIQKHIDKPVHIANDATVAGYAESIAGVSAGAHSSVFITLGTGVGGGIVINGRPYSGFHGVGSEIGHMTLEIDGIPCTCGKKGCLERYCSATAVNRMAQETVINHPNSLINIRAHYNPERMNAKIVFDAAREGDEAAVELFSKYVKYLSLGINSIISFLDPEIIVLGGGISKAGDFLLEAVRKELPNYVLFNALPYSRIEIASLGSEAGIIGAALLGK